MLKDATDAVELHYFDDTTERKLNRANKGLTMSASHEWCEYHLTPRGWELGGYQWDCGQPRNPPPPPDRAMTVEVHERLSSIYSTPKTEVTTTWRSANPDEIERLLRQYGSHQKTVTFGD